MAEPFDEALPTVGQKPWSLNPAVTEIRGRLGGVEDFINGPGLEERLVETAAELNPEALSDEFIASQIDASGSETNSALTAKIVETGTEQGWGAASSDELAWRGEYFDTAFRPIAPEDFPVITIGTTSQIADGVVLREKRIDDVANNPADVAGDPRFFYPGTQTLEAEPSNPGNYLRTITLPDGNAQAARYMAQVETITDPTNRIIELRMRSNVASPAVEFRLSVDGRWATYRAQRPAGIAAGANLFLTLTFPFARSRRIGYADPGRILGFGGMKVPTGQSLYRPGPQRLLAAIGDSFLGGAQGISRIETWGALLARLLGYQFVNLGVGGTGFVNNGGGGTTAFPVRAPVAASFAPDMVVILGSVNDGSASASQITAAVQQTLSALASVPEVYVVGPPRKAYATQNAAQKAAVEAGGRVFIDALAGDWWPDDELAALVGADGVHPTMRGQERLATRTFEAIRRAQAK